MSKVKAKLIIWIFFPTIFLVIFLAGIIVFVSASWSGLPYNSGETLVPGCAVGQVGCHVKPLATPGANTDITSLAGLVRTTATGTNYFMGGNFGIGTTNPTAKLTLIDSTFLVYGKTPNAPTMATGTGLLAVPFKGVLLSGINNTSNWNNLGNYIFSSGMYNDASSINGAGAMFGYMNSGLNQSMVAGYKSLASGGIALGKNVSSVASWSFTAGSFLTASSSAGKAIVLGAGIDDSNRLVNKVYGSFMVGFNSTLPTFAVNQAAGTGTIGKVGIGTSSPTDLLTVSAQSGTSTITIGQPGATPSCLKLEDSDKGGFTYCVFLDGAMLCSQDDCAS